MTEPTTRATVVSADLARTLNNGMVFLSPRVQGWQFARVTIGPTGLEILATDNYTIGYDSCDVETFDGEPVELILHKKSIATLERAARFDRKGTGRLEWFEGDCLRFTAGEPTRDEEAEVAVADGRADSFFNPDELWPNVAKMLERIERTEPDCPYLLTVDPDLLSRFSKVKAAKGENIADIAISGPRDPWLVKIGPTFVGVLCGVDREGLKDKPEIAAEGALWDD